MSRWLSLVVLMSCTNSPRGSAAAPPPPVAAAPAPSPPAHFHFAALTANHSLVITSAPGPRQPGFYDGFLVIDGHVTSAGWTGQPPQTYPISPGRWLLYDAYDGNYVWIWESGPARLSELGRAALVTLPGAGHIIMTSRDDVAVYSDFDPERPALHQLFAAAQPLGMSGGQIVLWQSASPGESVFTTLAPSGARVAHRVTTGALSPTTEVRGTQVLLVGNVRPSGGAGGAIFERPFSFDVAVADFATGTVRPVGTHPGCWTSFTNVPHPYFGARWASSGAPGNRAGELDCDAVVANP